MVKSIARITHLVYTVIIQSLNRAFLFKNEANRIISEQDFFCFNTMYDDRQYVVSLTVKKKPFWLEGCSQLSFIAPNKQLAHRTIKLFNERT